MLAPNGIAQNLDKVARELTSQYKVVYGRPQTHDPAEDRRDRRRRARLTMRGTPARTTKKGA